MSKPAPAVSTSPKATSPTISDARSQSRPIISLLPPSFKVETRSVFEAAMAGTMPKINPAARDTRTANESTRGSTPASAARGTLSPMRERMAGGGNKAKSATSESTHGAQHQAFRQQLAYQPLPACPQSRTHRDLPLPFAHPCQQ